MVFELTLRSPGRYWVKKVFRYFAKSVSTDFSSQGFGNVISFFYGHTHSEQVFTRNGIKYISIWNDIPEKERL